MSDENTTLRPESPLNQKTRESGFYWIRRNWPGLDSWQIGFYDGCQKWFLVGARNAISDEEIAEIDERPITREEPIAPKISGTSVRTLKKE